VYHKIKTLVDSSRFQNLIIALIIFNGITMGIETSKELMVSYGSLIHLLDKLVIGIFTLEIAMRIYVHRVGFFKDPWSLFDFFVVSISLVPASESFAVLRILRVFRLFRLVTVVPQMRKIVSALLSVIPGMLSIAGLMTLIFYIFAIMATNLYSQTFPQWFGSLGESFYTLFQIMTLESWSMGIVRPVMEIHPNAWIFFVPFIFIATFVMINLVVAVIVDAMAILKEDEEQHIVEEIVSGEKELHQQLKELKVEISELKTLLQQHKS